jgi:dolichol-phosphate mannosyltransferase
MKGMRKAPPELQILLPVHNEAESIADTIREIEKEMRLANSHEFILCEDGSKDDSKAVLRRIAEEVPARLLLSEARKGYSRAVRDGMLSMDASYLLCLDADGQCDPKDFYRFWEQRETADILIGWRVHRADNWIRRCMSAAFWIIWKALYACRLHDPSCPFLLARREVIQAIAPHMGAMQQGFWWEFVARAHRIGYSVKELPVQHRKRAAGTTQVYRLGKLPGIGFRHFLALFQILRETPKPPPQAFNYCGRDRAA